MVAKVQADIRQVQKRLAQIAAKGGDTSAALGAFGRVILNRIRLGFRLGRSPGGAAWEGLKFRIGQPLRDTGALSRSIVMAQGRDAVTIGTNKVQAAVHQFGAIIVPRNGEWLRFRGPGGGFIFSKRVEIPARPFMPLDRGGNAELPPEWAKAGLDAMKEALKL